MKCRRNALKSVLALMLLWMTAVPLQVAADTRMAVEHGPVGKGLTAGHSPSMAADSEPPSPAAPSGVWVSRWILWPLGLAECWLVGSLATWGIMLWVAPLQIRRINDRLSQIRVGDWKLNDGTQVTLAHLLLVRAFVSNERVVDAWIQSRQELFRNWHAIEVEATDGVDIEIRGERIPVTDAASLRSYIGEDRSCLALYGESRRWDARVLNGLLRLTLHPRAALWLTKRPLLPVVLDRKCLERLTRRRAADGEADEVEASSAAELTRLIHSELLRIRDLEDDVTPDWLAVLMDRKRLLVVVEDWHRTPVQTRNLISQTWLDDQLGYLLIVSGGASVPALPELIPITAPSEGDLPAAADDSRSVDELPEQHRDLQPNLQLFTEQDDEDSPEAGSVSAPEHAALPVSAKSPMADDAVAAVRFPLSGDARQTKSHDTAGVDDAAGRVASDGDASDDASDNDASDGDAATGSEPVLIRFPAGSATTANGAVEVNAAEPSADLYSTEAANSPPPASELLERLGDAACSVIPTLSQALNSASTPLREQAVGQLSQIVLAVLPQLGSALDDDDVSVRRQAAQTLSRMEAQISAVVTLAIHDADATVRREAVAALSTRQDPEVEPLTEALSDRLAETRRHAARALGAMGAHAAPAVPELVELLNDDCRGCRCEAARALGKIGPAAVSACEPLTLVLLEDSRAVRAAAAEALCGIGHMDAGILTALCEATEDSDPGVRRHAVVALGQLGLGRMEAVASIRAALADDSPVIRAAACRALSELGPEAREAIPDLEKLLTDESVEVRRAVVSAVSQIDLTSVPLLRQALDDVDADVRRAAAAALSGIGLAVMPRLLERDDVDEILAGLQSDGLAAPYEERSA